MKQNSFNKFTSIILVTRNQLKYLKLCLESIQRYTKAGTYEVIVVDNNSLDGTQEYLLNQKELKVILNSANQGLGKAYEQGAMAAAGTEYLFMYASIVASENWLTQLQELLYADAVTGAVEPVIQQEDCLINSAISPENFWHTLTQKRLAILGQQKAPSRQVLIFTGLCLLVKQEVIQKIGLFDTEFQGMYLVEHDYSFRIILADYQIRQLCHTIVYKLAADAEFDLRQVEHNGVYFSKKWGFYAEYSSNCRHDLLACMTASGQSLKILEIGCACGATLMELKSMYPQAQLHGIELNPVTAQIAGKVADVISADVETTKNVYLPDFFDYIICGDVLEHLHNPLAMLQNLAQYLKPTGKFLVSIPNVMHFSNVFDLLKGNWHYLGSGILDRTHLRFFTAQTIIDMFKKAGFVKLEFKAAKLAGFNQTHQVLLEKLLKIEGLRQADHFLAYQWLVTAQRNRPSAVDERELVLLLQRIENGIIAAPAREQLIQLCCDKRITMPDLLRSIHKGVVDKVKMVIGLAAALYERKMIEDSLALLKSAAAAYQHDSELSYARAFMLNLSGDVAGAKQVLIQAAVISPEMSALQQELEQAND